MSVRLRDVVMAQLDTLRHEPTEKRIRATIGDQTVVDSTRALLVWEPKRVVPTYAVPLEDVAGQIDAAAPTETARPDDVPAPGASHLGERMVYDPSVPFSAHTTDGEVMTVRTRGSDRVADAFRPADRDLADYVLLDFAAFDAWYEEDERNVAHPRDPFHRVDILHSSRHVRVEVGGTVLAESTAPYLLFEPPLPVRLLRGRRRAHRPVRAERSPHVLRLQGGGVVLVGGGRTAPRVVLPAPAPRRVGSRRPDRVLQRARRPGRGRRAARAADHAVVTTCLSV